MWTGKHVGITQGKALSVPVEWLIDLGTAQVSDAHLLCVNVTGDMLLAAPDTHARVTCPVLITLRLPA